MKRYSDNQIKKTISSGGVRAKITLYLRDRMGYYGQGFILSSYAQAKELSQSVKDVDRMEWEERVSMGLRIENSFKDLQLILTKTDGMKRDLLRILREIQEFENLEILLNRIGTLRLGVDKKVFSDEVLMGDFKMIHPTTPDFQTGVSLGLSGENSLREQARKAQTTLKNQIRTYLCYERAVENVVEVFRPEIPEYKDYLRENRRRLEEPIPVPKRFTGGDRSKRTPFPALSDLLEDYSVRVSEINIEDEDSLKMIQDFEKTI